LSLGCVHSSRSDNTSSRSPLGACTLRDRTLLRAVRLWLMNFQ
jgi:hypothetical protein